MKPDDILDALAHVGDDLLEEADALRQRNEKVTDIRSRRPNLRKWTALAASVAVLLVAGGLVFRFVNMRAGSAGPQQAAEATADAVINEAAEAGGAAKTEEAEAPAMAADAEAEAEEITEETAEDYATAGEVARIRVSTEAGEIVIELNESDTAQSLLAQLPFKGETEAHGENEGILFRLPSALDVGGDVAGCSLRATGTLAYDEAENCVIIHYGSIADAPGLYPLGEVTEGAELIPKITGMIEVNQD